MRFHSRITASAGAPGVWNVVLIRAGRSDNGNEYPAEDLRRKTEAGLFEGRPAMAFPKVTASGAREYDHVVPASLVGRTVANQVGFYRETRWNEAAQQVEGRLHLLLATEDGRRMDAHLRALEASGGLDSLGLSIDGEGPQDATGRVLLSQITSVDVVSHPSAGGAVLHRIAASRGFGASTMRNLLALLTAVSTRLTEGFSGDPKSLPALARHVESRCKADRDCLTAVLDGNGEKGWGDGKRFTEATGGELLDQVVKFCQGLMEQEAAAVAEASKTAAVAEAARAAEAKRVKEAADAAAAAAAAGGSRTTDEDRRRIEALEKANQAFQLADSRRRLESACVAAKLPAGAHAALLLQHGNRVLEAGEETRIVESMRRVVDDAIGSISTVTIVRESVDRTRDLLAHAFNPMQVPAPKEGVPNYTFAGSEVFERHLFGGVRVVEALYGGDAGRRRLRESVDSTSSAKTLQDAMNIALLAAYESNDIYSQWRKISRPVPLSTFRTHNVVKVPYYGNLPVVGKGDPYLAFTTPTETQEQISLVKYGGVESILLEDMINGDFLDIWQQRLQRLGQAAMETRSEIVHALHRDLTMPTMSADSKTLTDSTRSPANEGTAALTPDATGVANFWASVAAMMASTGGSGVAKGILPRYIVIPRAKMAAWAYVAQSFAGGMTGVNVPEGLAKLLKLAVPEAVIDVRTSNATDWYLFADPAKAEVIRTGELAGRGGPRIDIADALSFGAMLTNDKLEAKISDVFAAAAVDFAGIYGNDAAS